MTVAHRFAIWVPVAAYHSCDRLVSRTRPRQCEIGARPASGIEHADSVVVACFEVASSPLVAAHSSQPVVPGSRQTSRASSFLKTSHQSGHGSFSMSSVARALTAYCGSAPLWLSSRKRCSPSTMARSLKSWPSRSGTRTSGSSEPFRTTAWSAWSIVR